MRVRSRFPSSRAFRCLVCAVALFASGCAREAARPNVLVVVLDTLRADRLGAYGSTRGLTPFLDELAARAVVFERAYASSSWTSPSIASLLTSRHPLQHGVMDFDSALGHAELTLAEILHPLGYRTAGFSANFRLAEGLGYAQGFDHWEVYLPQLTNPEADPKVRASSVRRRLSAWLDGAADDARPTLLYVHLMDVHSPYDPPDPLRLRFAPDASRAVIDDLNARLHDLDASEPVAFTDAEVTLLERLYDAEVAGLDAELAKLFSGLEARRFLDDAIVLVLADHGEEFREHGALLHGATLFEAGVRVPLLMLAPGLEAGQRVPEPVSLLDVAPTLLALLEVPAPDSFEGRSLLARLAGSAQEEGEVLLDIAAPLEKRTHALGVVRGSRKLLVDTGGVVRVYDLAQDPAESAPTSSPEAAPDLVAALVEARRSLEADASPAVRIELDEQTRAGLRALGYAVDPEATAP